VGPEQCGQGVHVGGGAAGGLPTAWGPPARILKCVDTKHFLFNCALARIMLTTSHTCMAPPSGNQGASGSTLVVTSERTEGAAVAQTSRRPPQALAPWGSGQRRLPRWFDKGCWCTQWLNRKSRKALAGWRARQGGQHDRQTQLEAYSSQRRQQQQQQQQQVEAHPPLPCSQQGKPACSMCMRDRPCTFRRRPRWRQRSEVSGCRTVSAWRCAYRFGSWTEPQD
jgi:hypothetical protein